MSILDYPINFDYVSKKKKKIKRELLESDINFVEKKIAILNGSTSDEVKNMLEVFLLNQGIKPIFYSSEYNKYFEDAVFPSDDFLEFNPDIVYIHTTYRNIINLPTITDSDSRVDELLGLEFARYENIWSSLFKNFSCQIIQNNFDRPSYRLLGNADIYLPQGVSNFVSRLNQKFYSFAKDNKNFYVNDIDYLSSEYGLEKWHDLSVWYMYKCAFAIKAIPRFSFNLSNIIKSILGKNKKSFVLDMDNTLWGGVIGDDGVDNIVLGPETPVGQAYSDFQTYIKEHKKLGVILNISSKNDHENAISGLNHPDSTLSEDDFICIKANWQPKDRNVVDIANQINIFPDSLVFIDDNPAEREIVTAQVPGVIAAVIDSPENYINVIDKSGFFEVTNLSQDDFKRNEMYKNNQKRAELKASFTDYHEYLVSLEMVGTIKPFEGVYIPRIAQLTNKSNQFNLTTKRYTQTEIEQVADSENYVTLYGKLEDKFGDNGVVSVIIGEIKDEKLHIDLWIMSCRVLKRDMEFAMMDALVKICLEKEIKEIVGYYYPTIKNGMVKDFYNTQGFDKLAENSNGDSEWSVSIDSEYQNKNKAIEVR